MSLLPAVAVVAVPQPSRYVARCACGWRSSAVDSEWTADALSLRHQTWHLETIDLEAADRG